MKKALHITLAGSLFTIEEDAYEKLNHYLNSIKDYFGKLHDSSDVIEDIEARIAERLLEAMKSHNNIVTITDVETVITSMGTIEEISGETSDKAETEDDQPQRKLFRDNDTAVVAGVASGLSIYFDMDPLIMRCIFIVLTLITGSGFILAYIALAIFIPKAVTEADKVKMRGGPVTLSSFKETFADHVNNVSKSTKKFTEHDSKVRSTIERVIDLFGKLVRMFTKIVIKLAGIFLTVIPVLVAIALTFITTNLMFNVHGTFIDFPFEQVLPPSMYYIMIIVVFLILLIPLLLVASLGLSLLSLKRKISGSIALGLFGLWIVAILLGGTFAVQYGPDVINNIDRLPPSQRPEQIFRRLNNVEEYHMREEMISAPETPVAPLAPDTESTF